jgi:hypothetical protein
MKITTAALVKSFIVQAILKNIIPELTKMSQAITDLQAAVDANTAAANAAIANETALKTKLDAAIASNIDLTAQLAAAQANASNPVDTTAVVAATGTLAATTQKLTDATATTNPAN